MKKTPNRRKFISDLSRAAILTVLVSGSAYLVFREEENDEQCDFEFICQNCKKVKSCEIDEAQRYKQSN